MIKLSIVIPVYNGSQYISGCLEQLERQTFQDWEAIFVNDGSSDETKEILDKLVSKREKCRAFHQENGGTAKARNTGLAHASGTYATFLDVDDELDPHMYETLVRIMDNTGADMGICGYYFKVEQTVDGIEQTTYLEKKNYPKCLLKDRGEIKKRLVDLWDKDMLSNVWNKIYRMDLIREKSLSYRVGHVYTEDRVFNRLFIENCSSIAVTPKCLYYYVRERSGSTTEKYRDDYFSIRHKEYIEFQTHFKNMGIWDEVSREYVCREFVERISGCIENLFHAEKVLTETEKMRKIRWIISYRDVRTALRYARCRSIKMKVLVIPIKMHSTFLTYLLYRMVYLIRKKDPVLFHKLKGKR